jgi:hypothetical protein
MNQASTTLSVDWFCIVTMAETFSQKLTISPLENGDRLNREEFERQYETMPNLKKAKLIEGIVYLPAALRFQSHGEPHGWIRDLVRR